MIRQHYPKVVIAAAALALVLACTLANAKRPAAAATKTKVVEVAKLVGEPVAYDALEHHVGDEIAIETTFNTVRRGKLVKYTNPTLTIQLGPEHGSIELSVPRETIRSISVLPAAPARPEAGAKQEQGNRSAKKN
jgi:hypothetical protein